MKRYHAIADAQATVIDITERTTTEAALRLSHQVLGITNHHTELQPMLREVVAAVKDFTLCEAVGIRILDKDGNIPYQAYSGFSRDFYERESPLSIRSDCCMCVRVIEGQTDPALSFFTPGGSFYMNGTTRFLATVSEQDKGRTRNVCNEVGFESVALIPIRSNGDIVGLIHVADSRENCVPLPLVQTLENVAMQLGIAVRRAFAEDALRRSEQKFRESEKALAAVFDSAPVTMLVVDADRRVCNANRAALEATGRSAEQIVGLRGGNAMRCLHALDDPRGCGFGPHCEECTIRRVVTETLETGNSHRNVEVRLSVMADAQPDERVLQISTTRTDTPTAPLVLICIEDITERKRAEERLHDSEERLRLTLEAAQIGTWDWDVKNDLWYASPIYYSMLGYEPKAGPAERHEWLDRLHPEDRAYVQEKIQDVLTRDFEEYQYEARLRHADGTYRWEYVRGFGIQRDENRKVTRMLGIRMDITEQKRAQRQAEQREAELLHVSRLSTLGEMASGFAHELNQPLTAIMSYASASLRAIQSDRSDGSRLTKNLEQIVAQSTRAGEIIRRVRALAQRRPPSLSPVEINKVIRDTLDLLGSDLRHRQANVVLELSQDLPRVLADSIQIEQVLLNLIRNAAEAMEAVDAQRRRLTLRTSVAGKDGVQVVVSDTGPGISPEMTAKIFDPFFTTKEKGLGIGLSITRSILELHRGHLWVDPGPGSGCTFTFTLPAAQSGAG